MRAKQQLLVMIEDYLLNKWTVWLIVNPNLGYGFFLLHLEDSICRLFSSLAFGAIAQTHAEPACNREKLPAFDLRNS